MMSGQEKLNKLTMKKVIYIVVLLILASQLQAQDSTGKFDIPIKNWNLKILGLRNLYPTYLADPLGIRFEVSIQNFKYGDWDHQDKINTEGTYKGRLNITPGFRFSLLKFTSRNNPKLGIEIDLGASIPVHMRQGNNDMIGTDGIYYIGLAGTPAEWLSFRFLKHHICTHIGDEYAVGGTSSPVGFDPNIMQLPVRDDFILSASVKPLWFLKNPKLNILHVYGDFGFFMPGVDFLGTRQNKPHREAYLNYQYGAEIEYYFKQNYLGGVFTAINVSAYQTNAFAKNLSIKWGYLVPQDRWDRRLSVGLNYYNGRSITNQYYNRKEKWLAFFVFSEI
jgi:hypothetical protein